MTAFKRYRDVGIVIILLAVPFFFLRANMKRPENLNGLDRVVLRISAPIEFAASSLARGVSNLWESYVYLVDVKADNERLAYENARLHEQVASPRAEGDREPRAAAAPPAPRVAARRSRERAGRRQGLHRVLPRHARRARPRLAQHPPAHAGGQPRRRRRRGARASPATPIDVQLSVDAAFGIDVVDERTHARGFVRGTGDPSHYCVQGRERRLARRGRDRRSPRHERQGQVVPQGPAGRARDQGRQARARARSGDRSDARP